MSVPEVCMEYTKIFQTVKLEMFICLAVVIVIGIISKWLAGK
jgi:hypothetical protein